MSFRLYIFLFNYLEEEVKLEWNCIFIVTKQNTKSLKCQYIIYNRRKDQNINSLCEKLKR